MDQGPTTSREANASVKRNILADTFSENDLPDPKRPKIEFEKTTKVKVLTLICNAYEAFLLKIFPEKADRDLALKSFTVSHSVARIILTEHDVARRTANGMSLAANIPQERKTTSAKVNWAGKQWTITNEDARVIWENCVRENGLEYKKYFVREDNWYLTIEPYINFFDAHRLRVNELINGHETMPIRKVGGVMKSIPVAKYGINVVHHILMEGCSFPPERRLALAQSIGPLTSLICMIRADKRRHKEKYSNVIKQSMAHVPFIDNIIEVLGSKNSGTTTHIINLVANILCMTPSSQECSMFFPLCMFHYVYRKEENKDLFLENFNVSGTGGYYTYREGQKAQWLIRGTMTPEIASQVAFHGIFGTYKEDLSILSQVTNCGNWYTREEMGDFFSTPSESEAYIEFQLPKLTHYKEISRMYLPRRNTGHYGQVISSPVFAGRRVVHYSESFFEYLDSREVGYSGMQLANHLYISLREKYEELLKRDSEPLDNGTVQWHDIATLTLTAPGEVVQPVLRARRKFFWSKS